MMTLVQLQVLKADIAANTNTVTIGGASVAIKDVTHTPDNADVIAAWYNLDANPAYRAWRTDAAKPSIDAQLVKSAFTPSDAPDTTQIFENRAMVCQLKQFNAQWLTAGDGVVNAALASVRTNFQDCLTSIPSGAGGVNQNAGWGTPASPGAVRLALMRTVRNVEKLFVTTAQAGPGNVGTDARGSTTNPDALGFEGAVDEATIVAAWNS